MIHDAVDTDRYGAESAKPRHRHWDDAANRATDTVYPQEMTLPSDQQSDEDRDVENVEGKKGSWCRKLAAPQGGSHGVRILRRRSPRIGSKPYSFPIWALSHDLCSSAYPAASE